MGFGKWGSESPVSGSVLPRAMEDENKNDRAALHENTATVLQQLLMAGLTELGDAAEEKVNAKACVERLHIVKQTNV